MRHARTARRPWRSTRARGSSARAPRAACARAARRTRAPSRRRAVPGPGAGRIAVDMPARSTGRLMTSGCQALSLQPFAFPAAASKPPRSSTQSPGALHRLGSGGSSACAPTSAALRASGGAAEYPNDRTPRRTSIPQHRTGPRALCDPSNTVCGRRSPAPAPAALRNHGRRQKLCGRQGLPEAVVSPSRRGPESRRSPRAHIVAATGPSRPNNTWDRGGGTAGVRRVAGEQDRRNL